MNEEPFVDSRDVNNPPSVHTEETRYLHGPADIKNFIFLWLKTQN